MTTKPLPDITAVNALFWEGTAAGELRVRRCRSCGARFRFVHEWCPSCWSSDIGWEAVSGRGRIATFTVVHTPPYPAFEDVVPFVLALVDLDEGVRMMCNIVGCAPENVRIGMPVAVTFEDRGGIALPQFSPAG